MPFPQMPKSLESLAKIPFEVPANLGKSLFEGGKTLERQVMSLRSQLSKGPQMLQSVLPQGLPQGPMPASIPTPADVLNKGGEIVGEKKSVSGSSVRTTIY